MTQQPLALEASAFTEARGWRRGQHLIDALPYIDSLTPEEKRRVDKMIEEEMRLSAKSPADYLRELPPLPQLKFEGHPVLQNEYERVRSGTPMQALDVSRYRLDPPPLTRRNDYSAWRQALDNAHSQLEHQYNRLLNLELLFKYGPAAWRTHNEALDAHNKRLEAAIAQTKAEIDTINKERKLEQFGVRDKIQRAEDEWKALVLKNFEIETACRRLQEEIDQLKAKVPASAPAPSEEQTAAPVEEPVPVEED